MTRRVVPASIVPSLIDQAVLNRLNVAKIFDLAGVDPDLISNPDAFLSYSQVGALYKAITETSDDAAIGLHAGETSKYQNLDVVGHLIATSETVRGALFELFRYKDLIGPFIQFELVEESGKARLKFHIDDEVSFDDNRYYNELISASVVTLGRKLVGEDLSIVEVCFSHPQPDYLSEYERIFKVPVHFSCQSNEIVFHHSALSMPILSAFPDYHDQVEQVAAEKLQKLIRGEDLSSQIEEFILQNIGRKSISLETVAEQFHVTSRTLQRKLKLENASFAEIRDGIRHRLAIKYLKDKTMDIESVAHRLGFSDASNFYHAFKRWEGKSPGEFRKSLKNAH